MHSPITRSPWLEFAADAYLDHRHRNWVIAEELGDVVFVTARDIVLVHRHGAGHIIDALDAARPARPSAPRVPTPPTPTMTTTSRMRGLLGWIGIMAGAAVLVTALAMPLDDPALVVALMLGMRGGRSIRDIDT